MQPNQPTYQDSSFLQSPHPPTKRYVYVGIAAGILVLLLLVIAGVISTIQRKQNVAPTQTQNTSPTPSVSTPVPFPTVVVGQVISSDSSASFKKTTAIVYPVKNLSTESDFNSLAKRFITTSSTQIVANGFMAQSNDARDASSIVFLDTKTGSYLYRSGEGVALPQVRGTSISEDEQVLQFVKNITNDQTLAVTAQYSKKNVKDVRYYEIHRDWNKFQMPILNLLGIFNLPKNTSLTSLQVGENFPNAPKYDIIEFTSDNTNGLKRPNAFNTITAGVQNGKIVSFVSNMRKLDNTTQHTVQLITYDQAVGKLKSNQFAHFLVTPQDSTANTAALYPNQTAQLKTVTIEDAVLTYLEEVPEVTQDSFVPYYVFRGEGTLSGGQKVNFTAAVNASSNSVLGALTSASATQDTSQKQGTLTAPSSTPNRSETVTQPQATVAPPLPVYNSGGVSTPYSCTPTKDQLTQVQTYNGVTYGQDPSSKYWYVIPNSQLASMPIQDLMDLLDQVYTQIVGTSGAGAKSIGPAASAIISNTKNGVAADCPVGLVTGSPSVFAYNAPANFSFIPHVMVTKWLKQPGYTYYEYAPLHFSRPSNGWHVAQQNLQTFSDQIARSLQLTPLETKRLYYELQFAVNHLSLQNTNTALFIGLIPQSEIDAKLPLTFSRKPDRVVRYHFYVSPENRSDSVTPPQLAPINHSGFFVLELGAATP